MSLLNLPELHLMLGVSEKLHDFALQSMFVAEIEVHELTLKKLNITGLLTSHLGIVKNYNWFDDSILNFTTFYFVFMEMKLTCKMTTLSKHHLCKYSGCRL